MGRFRRAFTAKEKLAAIAFAEAQGNRAAGREFSVDESCIRQWRKQKSKLQAMPATKKADRGKSEQFPQMEEKVLEWVLERCLQGNSFINGRDQTSDQTHRQEASHNWVPKFGRLVLCFHGTQ